MKRVLVLLAFAAIAISSICVGASAEEAKEKKLKFSGDFRGRWEGFWFREDPTGSQIDDRRRLRYRLRLNLDATLGPHVAAALRVGSGSFDSRSGNQTIGSPIDFGPNTFELRRAYMILMPFANGGLPKDNGHWAFQFGRLPNPLLWKNGKDLMLWDGDINPGGVSTTFDIMLGKTLGTFANAGYFVIEEKKGEKDPSLSVVQIGFEEDTGGNLSAGIRGTFYAFENLDTLFVIRGVDGTAGVTSGGGNIPDGLTGSVGGGSMRVVATQFYVKTKTGTIVAYGGYSSNLSAEASKILQNVGKENTAYNMGIEGGNAKRYLRIGIAYYFIEANAFPSQFIDSDLLDGRTNRKGVLVYLSRQVFKDTTLGLALFSSDPIETAPEFAESVVDSKRTRAQLDLMLKF